MSSYSDLFSRAAMPCLHDPFIRTPSPSGKRDRKQALTVQPVARISCQLVALQDGETIQVQYKYNISVLTGMGLLSTVHMFTDTPIGSTTSPLQARQSSLPILSPTDRPAASLLKRVSIHLPGPCRVPLDVATSMYICLCTSTYIT